MNRTSLLLDVLLLGVLAACGSASSPARGSPPTPPMRTTVYTYRGHHNTITAVAWAPVTGYRFAVYRGHTNWVSAIAWSPDGKYLASASFDKTVQVWEAPLDLSRPLGHGDRRRLVP